MYTHGSTPCCFYLVNYIVQESEFVHKSGFTSELHTDVPRCGAHCGEGLHHDQILIIKGYMIGIFFYIREMPSTYCLIPQGYFFKPFLLSCLLFYSQHLGKLAAFALCKVLVWRQQVRNIPFTARRGDAVCLHMKSLMSRHCI